MPNKVIKTAIIASFAAFASASAHAYDIDPATVYLTTQAPYRTTNYESTLGYSFTYTQTLENTFTREGAGYIDNAQEGNVNNNGTYFQTSSAVVDRDKLTVSAATTYFPGNPNFSENQFNTSAGLGYYIELAGDAGSVAVNIQTSGTTSATNGRSFASFSIVDPDYNNIAYYNAVSDTINDTFGAPTSFNSNNALFYLQANTLYYVALSVSAEGTSSAFVDPTFTISSSNTSSYKFLESAGIGPLVSPVPLPAAAPMFGAALLGLAGLSYAAKCKKAAAAA